LHPRSSMRTFTKGRQSRPTGKSNFWMQTNPL
jgi:hypothetical protein